VNASTAMVTIDTAMATVRRTLTVYEMKSRLRSLFLWPAEEWLEDRACRAANAVNRPAILTTRLNSFLTTRKYCLGLLSNTFNE